MAGADTGGAIGPWDGGVDAAAFASPSDKL
jgi:hypothetical protein